MPTSAAAASRPAISRFSLLVLAHEPDAVAPPHPADRPRWVRPTSYAAEPDRVDSAPDLPQDRPRRIAGAHAADRSGWIRPPTDPADHSRRIAGAHAGQSDRVDSALFTYHEVASFEGPR